jgi:hypothetical protein
VNQASSYGLTTVSDGLENARLGTTIYTLDPLSDGRWDDLVRNHKNASAFHQRGWLEALARTYGYKPIVFTTSSPSSELRNSILFCYVNSWLTGRRLVSLPFSDHCDTLCESNEEILSLTGQAKAVIERQGLKYVEVRPNYADIGQTAHALGFRPAGNYFLHVIDLKPELEELFQSFHRDSVRRRIKRAERAGLVEKCGSSEDLLKEFYALFVVTRKRHRLPPIPYAWFENLVQCLPNGTQIRMAFQEKTPIAAVLTLHFRNTIYYKYGCSNTRYNRFGAIPWLLWNAISAGKLNGAAQFDMGRTQEGNEGLIAFKNHWVANPKRLVYWRFPFASSFASVDGWKLNVAKHIFSCMPTKLLTMTGRLVYRHIG